MTEIERLGFDSIWVTDHIVIPEGVRDAQLIYREHMLEAFTVFGFLAAVSHRVQLGSSIIVLAYRNPIVMAKMLASIDVLSGGRVIFGAAAGYMEGEFYALGARFEERGDVSDEYLRVIREIWTHDQTSFSGRYFNFDKVYTSPRPVQQPGPPIWIGGRSKRAMRRAVELGDGWHPIGLNAQEMKEGRAYMARLCERRQIARVPAMSLRANLLIEGVLGAGGALRGPGRQHAVEREPFIDQGSHRRVRGSRRGAPRPGHGDPVAPELPAHPRSLRRPSETGWIAPCPWPASPLRPRM